MFALTQTTDRTSRGITISTKRIRHVYDRSLYVPDFAETVYGPVVFLATTVVLIIRTFLDLRTQNNIEPP